MIRLSFSAVSHVGELCAANEDRIYASGRFTASHEMDNVQLSFESNETQFIFAVSEAMENAEDDDKPGISITDELLKLQKKSKNSIKDIQSKLDEMALCVEQMNNLLFSIALGDETKREKKPSFGGLLIQGDRAAAVNLGSCRIYKLEPENLRPLANDYKRTERLLKMGIITDEQAELLASQLGNSKIDGLTQVRKSDAFRLKEGDVLLICSNGLTEAVSEDAVFEIMSSGGETDEIAALLVKEAVGNRAGDNVTVAVVKVLGVDEEEPAKKPSQSIPGHLNKLAGMMDRKKMNTARLVSTFVAFVVIAAVLFGVYSLIASLRAGTSARQTADVGKETTAVSTDTTKSTSENTSGEGAGAETQAASGSVTQESQAAGANGGDTAGGTATTYKVKRGDSLFSISKKFYGDSQKYKLIMEANNIADANKIQVGQVLKIPASN